MGRESRRKAKALILTDRSAGGSAQNNYMKKLLMMREAGQLGKPGEVQEVNISHDKDCAVFAGGFCGCNPDITIKPP